MTDPVRFEAFNSIVNSAEGAAAVAELATDLTKANADESEKKLTEQSLPLDDAEVIAEQNRQAESARQAEQQRLANEAAQNEEAAYKAAGITLVKDAQGNVTKIIAKYQALDAQGSPIGHPTHLEASNWLELSQKQRAAHENALRLAERIKKQKVTFKKPESVQEEENVKKALLTDDQVREYLRVMQDPTSDSKKYLEVSDILAANQIALAQVKRKASDEFVTSENWKAKHIHDFKPNDANARLIDAFLKENNLEYTEDNLDIAFLALQSQLAPVQSVQAPEVIPADNTTTVQPSVTVPVVQPAPAPASQPVVAAPASAAVVNQTPVQRKPGAVGGIAPSSLTASRPATQSTPAFTKKDIAQLAKNPTEFRRRMKMEPGFEKLVNDVLAGRA